MRCRKREAGRWKNTVLDDEVLEEGRVLSSVSGLSPR